MRRCRLEWNNSGAWKLLATFDADAGEAADAVMNAAAALLDAVNDRASGRHALARGRVSSDEAHPVALMYHEGRGGGEGWKAVA